MRSFRAAAVPALVLIAAGVLAACGDSSGPSGTDDVIPAELAGSWIAEPACVPSGCGFLLSPVTSPTDTLNATATFGITTRMTLNRNGVFSLAIQPGNIPPSTGSARLGTQAGILIVTAPSGAVDTLDYTIAGNTLDFRIRRAYPFPYITHEGEPVPAIVRGIFHRN